MENKEKSLKEFVAGLDLSIINDEDSILLDSMVGTSGAQSLCNSDHNCAPKCDSTADNCHASNCAAGCGKK